MRRRILPGTKGGPALGQGGALAISALRDRHPPGTECHALKFVESAATVTFSADTAHFPPLAGFARGYDILVREAMLPEGVEAKVKRTGLGARLRTHLRAGHSTAAEAADMPRDAGVGPLVPHHLLPADIRRFPPGTGLPKPPASGTVGSRLARTVWKSRLPGRIRDAL